jgi:hypothetical protein
MYRMGGEVGKMGLEMVVSNCVMEFLCDPPHPHSSYNLFLGLLSSNW